MIVALTLFYTFRGGLTAVIWTDVLGMGLYVAGAAASLVVILHQIPGGWQHVVAVADAAHKFQVFDFRFALSAEFFARRYSFWAGLLGGAFLTTASHGVEQLMVQRLLAAKSEKDSRTALFASWFVICLQFTMFLFIGVLLFVYRTDAHLPPPSAPDRIYPEFVWQHLPLGLAGLVMASILAAGMSNLSAALNALSSTTVMDLYRPLARQRSEAHFLLVAKWVTVAWGGVLFTVGLVARHWGSVLEAGLTIASILYGSLLGVFLLGLLTKSVREPAAMTGMLAGLLTMLAVRFATNIAFTWYVLIGTAATFLAGWITSRLLGDSSSIAVSQNAEAIRVD